jgi:DNA-binding NtrC family response regulator
MQMLASYNWPGNVRELRNVIERLVLMTTAPEVLPDHLPSHLVNGPDGAKQGRASVSCTFPHDDLMTLAEIEREAIEHTLSCVDGNKTRAAEVLGISRQTLRTKLRGGALADS